MLDNLALWNAVEKTPVEHTKAITGKAYSGTSPKPHYLIRKATETFGPCGIGWGFHVEERIEDGALIDAGFFERMHIAKVTVWYEWQGKRGEVCHVGGTPFSGRRSNGRPYTDEDAPKKSVTDALVKALSMIGFAGDIFMGRYDDSKYVSDLKEEARESAKTEAQSEQRQERKQQKQAARKPGPRFTDAFDIQNTMDGLLNGMKQQQTPESLKEWATRQDSMISMLPDPAFAEFREAYTRHLAPMMQGRAAA